MVQRGLSDGYAVPRIHEFFHQRGYGNYFAFTGLANGLFARLSYLAVRNTFYKIAYDLRKPAKHVNDLTHREKGVISAIGGALGAIVSNPFEVRMVRQIGNLGLADQYVRSTANINVMAGIGPAVARAIVLNGFSIYVYDQTKERFWNAFGDSLWSKPWACMCVAAFATAFVLPIDAVKTRLQFASQDAAKNRLNYQNSLDCVVKAMRNETPHTLYAGAMPFFAKMFLYSISVL